MGRWDKSTERLPTIADCRRHGLTGFFVHCETFACPRSPARFSFDQLALADDVVFVEIATRHRRFVCRVCGRHALTLDLDWRDHNAVGLGRPPTRPAP